MRGVWRGLSQPRGLHAVRGTITHAVYSKSAYLCRGDIKVEAALVTARIAPHTGMCKRSVGNHTHGRSFEDACYGEWDDVTVPPPHAGRRGQVRRGQGELARAASA